MKTCVYIELCEKDLNKLSIFVLCSQWQILTLVLFSYRILLLFVLGSSFPVGR